MLNWYGNCQPGPSGAVPAWPVGFLCLAQHQQGASRSPRCGENFATPQGPGSPGDMHYDKSGRSSVSGLHLPAQSTPESRGPKHWQAPLGTQHSPGNHGWQQQARGFTSLLQLLVCWEEGSRQMPPALQWKGGGGGQVCQVPLDWDPDHAAGGRIPGPIPS